MKIHNLKRNHKNKKDRLVGRGGKHAKTSGRGGKGQTARAGNKRRPELRDIIKKLPKNRGYAFKSFEIKPAGVSLDKIEKAYPKGGKVNPASLLELEVIKKKKGWLPKVKILNGKESFSVKIEVSGCLVSDSAKEKILKQGGTIADTKKVEKEVPTPKSRGSSTKKVGIK